jgi:phage shock protein PspC (stress-responsive transcriptional regulator)
VTEETPEKEKRMDATSAPEPGAARPARPPLVRSRSDRKIAGVAGGLADHLNIDPLIVRIGFVASVFAGGLGLLLYLGGWILIPEEGDEDREHAQLKQIRELPLLGLVLFVVGGGLLLSQVTDWDSGATLWGLLLIGAGVLLFRDEKEDQGSEPSSHDGPSSTAISEQPTLPIASDERRVRRAITRPKRERSFLGRYTFAAMLIVVGGAGLLDYAGAFTLEVGQYPALALAVVGAGLLVGTLWGRSRGLIVLGLCLVPFALAGNLIDVPLEGGFGERNYVPSSAAAVDPGYSLVGGVMRFDLTDTRWGTDPVVIDATVAFGEIEVRVPDDVRVEFDGSVGAGDIDFFGENRAGYEVELEAVGGDPDATKTLIIDARVSMGSLDIDRTELEFEGERL